MAKKHRKPKLIDAQRCGTLIIGAYRLGTHFLQDVCCDLAEQQGLEPVKHQEVKLEAGWETSIQPQELPQRMAQLEQQPGYHVMIMNDYQHKSVLVEQPSILDRWHVIRIVTTDIERWFKSWFFFMHSPASQRPDLFPTQPVSGPTVPLHHSTPTEVYHEFLRTHAKHIPVLRLIYDLNDSLHNHLVSQLVPVDQEIVYDTLPQLITDATLWTPNHYPDLDFAKILPHGDVIATILARWYRPWPGKFKTTS